MPTPRPTIAQMDFERRALRARLEAGGLPEADAQMLIRKFEDLELAIAAAPPASPGDIGMKALILKETLNIELKGSLEAVLLEALVRDCLSLNDKTFVRHHGNRTVHEE